MTKNVVVPRGNIQALLEPRVVDNTVDRHLLELKKKTFKI